jgi:hypothetical protein
MNARYVISGLFPFAMLLIVSLVRDIADNTTCIDNALGADGFGA